VDKKVALNAIRKAKAAHIKWRSYAQALVAGVDVSDEKVPVAHTNCDFGRWYYGQGQAELGGLDSFQGIAAPHEMLHAIYSKIFDTLYRQEKRSLLQKIFARETAHGRYDQARAYMADLVAASETLLTAIDLLEKEIVSLDDD
jgi:hypothetical protein